MSDPDLAERTLRLCVARRGVLTQVRDRHDHQGERPIFPRFQALGFHADCSAVVPFQSSNVQFLPFASEYVGFVALILVVFGLSFELPLALVGLSAVGITSSRWLASKRLMFFFGLFLFATVVTPGADWISPLILGSILYVLFELSILVSRFLGR